MSSCERQSPVSYIPEERTESGMYTVIPQNEAVEIPQTNHIHQNTEGARPGYGKVERRTHRGNGPRSY